MRFSMLSSDPRSQSVTQTPRRNEQLSTTLGWKDRTSTHLNWLPGMLLFDSEQEFHKEVCQDNQAGTVQVQ